MPRNPLNPARPKKPCALCGELKGGKVDVRLGGAFGSVCPDCLPQHQAMARERIEANWLRWKRGYYLAGRAA